MSSHQLRWTSRSGTPLSHSSSSAAVVDGLLPSWELAETSSCESAEALLAELDLAREAQDHGRCARVASRLSHLACAGGELSEAQKYQQLAIGAALRAEREEGQAALGLLSLPTQDFRSQAQSASQGDWDEFEAAVVLDCRRLRVTQAIDKLKLAAGYSARKGEQGRAERYRRLARRLSLASCRAMGNEGNN